MINFYTQEEFETQMVELMVTEGLSQLEAYRVVSEREKKDAEDYHRWLDNQLIEEDIYQEFG